MLRCGFSVRVQGGQCSHRERAAMCFLLWLFFFLRFVVVVVVVVISSLCVFSLVFGAVARS